MGKMKYLLSFIILFSTIAYPQNNENSSEFKVQLTVTERCEIQSNQTQSIDFGSIQRSTNNVSRSGSLNVSCTQDTPYSIALHSDKTLKNTQDSSIQVPYQLYQDAGFKTVWGALLKRILQVQGQELIKASKSGQKLMKVLPMFLLVFTMTL
jgi:Uncharacterized secreted protein